jgi:hypothetical protein
MASFHALDPNVIVNALRLLLDGWKALRTKSGEKAPDEREKVLKETVDRAEELSAGGTKAETIVSEIEARLEQRLGPEAKDDIIARATALVALSQPFEVESFHYFDGLLRVLKSAQDFCKATNIFRLRGVIDVTYGQLELPRLASILYEISKHFAVITEQLVRHDVFQVRLVSFQFYLSTTSAPLSGLLRLELRTSDHVGGSYGQASDVHLVLTEGSEVNVLAFGARMLAEFPYRLNGMEFRVTATEFKAIASAIFDDLNDYVTDLAQEQKDFKEQVGPALTAILSALKKS